MQSQKFPTNKNNYKQQINLDKNFVFTFFLSIFLPLLVFTFLAVAVAQNWDILLAWDVKILKAIHATANPQLDWFAAQFTQLGIYWGVMPLVTILALVLFYLKRWRAFAYILITALGTSLISYTGKSAFHRPRPQLWELFYHLPSDYSFPSGHALSSMMLLVILLTLIRKNGWHQWVLILGSLFVLVIGWTRLYLGVHYPSDILAGWLLAIAWGMGVNLLLKPQK